jgi:hypothetical protein
VSLAAAARIFAMGPVFALAAGDGELGFETGGVGSFSKSRWDVSEQAGGIENLIIE